MERDLLFLLSPGFRDPAYPGQLFYCWHCAALEGVLALYPRIGDTLDVERIGWDRPRRRVVEMVGDAHQSLPLLLIHGRGAEALATGFANGHHLVAGVDRIMHALTVRHRIPNAHP